MSNRFFCNKAIGLGDMPRRLCLRCDIIESGMTNIYWSPTQCFIDSLNIREFEYLAELSVDRLSFYINGTPHLFTNQTIGYNNITNSVVDSFLANLKEAVRIARIKYSLPPVQSFATNTNMDSEITHFIESQPKRHKS